MENNYTNYHQGEQVTIHDTDGTLITSGIITRLGTAHASVTDIDGECLDVTYGMIRKATLIKTAENELIKEEEQDGKKFILSKSEKNVDGSITVAYEVTVDNKQVWKSEEVVTNVYDFENGWSAPDDFDDNKLELIQQTAESGFDMILESYDNMVALVQEQMAPAAAGELAESAPKGKPAFSPDAPKLEAEQGGDTGGGMGGGGGGGADAGGGGEPVPDGEGNEEPAPEAEGEAPKEGPSAGGVIPFAQEPKEELSMAASLERPSLARSVLSSKTDDNRLHNNPQHRLNPLLRAEMDRRGIDSGATNDLELSEKLKGFNYNEAPKKAAARIAKKLNKLSSDSEESPVKRPPKSEIDALITAYALKLYSQEQNAPIPTQTKFHNSFMNILSKMETKYPAIGFSGDSFFNSLAEKAKECWDSKAMRGPGVNW